MINKVLTRQVTFLMLFIGIMIVGVICFIKIPVELMPNASFGEISVIFAVRGGIPPDKIENFVTRPVEEALGSVGNLKDIISISEEGRATIVLKFAAGTNMDVAVMEVREKLSLVKNELPKEVERPIVAQYEQADIPIIIIGVTSPLKSAEEIRRIVDERVKERLSRVEGVANIDVFGGRERKIIIDVHPDKLQSKNLSMAKVINALNLANVSLLSGDMAPSTGGESKYTIKATGRFESIDDMRNLGLAISNQGSIVRLSDIAEVKDSYMDAENISRLDSNTNVTIYIQKETLASTVKVCDGIVGEILGLRNDLPPDMIISVIKNDSIFIKKALKSMKESLLIGGLLAAAILLFFLGKFNLTLINFFTIPLSVFLAVIFLFFNKISLNVMTLGGLALGVGMLLDNSICVIENIFRAYKDTDDRRTAVIEGTESIILPIIAATLTTIVVFLPIVFLSADIKQMQGPMAITITYSLIASLFVALTLVPLLFFKLKISPSANKTGFAMVDPYKRLLKFILGKRVMTLLIVGGCFAVALFWFTRIDMNLYETEEENKFTINVELPTGAKLEVSDEKVKIVEGILNSYKEVKQISSKIEKWSSKIYVTLHPAKNRKKSKEELIAELRPKFRDIQPAFIYFKESQALAAKEIFIDLYGYDYKVLKQTAMDVGGYIKAIVGLEDIKIRMREGRPEKIVNLDRDRIMLASLTVSDVAENLHAKLRGLIATRFHQGSSEIETIVRQDKSTLRDFDDVYRMKIMNNIGNYIQLSQLATFSDTKGPSEIWRKNKKRFVQVSASRKKISLEKAALQVREVLKHMEFPENYFYEIGGDYEIMLRTKKELYLALTLTIILVYLVLAALFESYVQPFIIMLAVPLSIIGVVIALLITKKKISTGVIMGIIMLAGIVVNNAIMLIDRINNLKLKNVKNFIVEGCAERLRPIMMTVATTILGLLPLAIKGGEGAGLWKPLSVTVIGGLISSTILVLFVVPCAYKIMEKFK